jgi:hypothetical protein
VLCCGLRCRTEDLREAVDSANRSRTENCTLVEGATGLPWLYFAYPIMVDKRQLNH